MEKVKIIKALTASFDVDAEKCFTPLCPNELPVPDGQNIVDELNAQTKFARVRVGSKDAHSPKAVWVTNDPDYIALPIGFKLGMKKDEIPPPPSPNVDFCWPVHGVPGTRGFELLDGLPKPIEYDYFVWKGMELDMHPYGACYHDLGHKFSTGVIEYLRNQGIVYVLLGGLAADYCEGLTGLELLDAKFKVIFNRAATRGLTPAGTEAMIKKLIEKGAVVINNCQELELI